MKKATGEQADDIQSQNETDKQKTEWELGEREQCRQFREEQGDDRCGPVSSRGNKQAFKETGTQFHPSQLKTDWHNILPESLKGTASVLYRGQLKRRQHHFTQQSSSDCIWEYH